ncbi:hypothetical protein GIB67_006080 [Kingdonia uniflora]|uniref:RanBP2-type domain-containing protein n=1 Tax=Kingdonia uniflora TaxID=39325 RepID=A0A7J7LPV5_9MAGN|nr:hypothetical protein GIB67_006080 [Kingdonia uniflora]
MATLRKLLFSPSFFYINKTLLSKPKPHLSQTLHSLSHRPPLLLLPLKPTTTLPQLLCRNIASSAVSLVDNGETTATLHPWPEWVTFIGKLQSKGYFVEGFCAVGDVGGGGVIGNNLSHVKIACLNFARERFDLLKSLSKSDIKTIVEHGCPNLQRKAVTSAKRLRVFVRLDESDVCSACNLRASCDSAYVILKDNEEDARTVDIVRMLTMYAQDPLVLSGGEKPHGRENVEESVRKLLSELVELSDTTPNPELPIPAVRTPRRKEKSEVFKDRENSQRVERTPRRNEVPQMFKDRGYSPKVERKSGDWICSKCDYNNFARNLRCLECKQEGPKILAYAPVEMKKGDWNCPECQFINFARNRICIRCSERRHLEYGDWECPSNWLTREYILLVDVIFLTSEETCHASNVTANAPNDMALQYEDTIAFFLLSQGVQQKSRDLVFTTDTILKDFPKKELDAEGDLEFPIFFLGYRGWGCLREGEEIFRMFAERDTDDNVGKVKVKGGLDDVRFPGLAIGPNEVRNFGDFSDSGDGASWSPESNTRDPWFQPEVDAFSVSYMLVELGPYVVTGFKDTFPDPGVGRLGESQHNGVFGGIICF